MAEPQVRTSCFTIHLPKRDQIWVARGGARISIAPVVQRHAIHEVAECLEVKVKVVSHDVGLVPIQLVEAAGVDLRPNEGVQPNALRVARLRVLRVAAVICLVANRNFTPCDGLARTSERAPADLLAQRRAQVCCVREDGGEVERAVEYAARPSGAISSTSSIHAVPPVPKPF